MHCIKPFSRMWECGVLQQNPITSLASSVSIIPFHFKQCFKRYDRAWVVILLPLSSSFGNPFQLSPIFSLCLKLQHLCEHVDTYLDTCRHRILQHAHASHAQVTSAERANRELEEKLSTEMLEIATLKSGLSGLSPSASGLATMQPCRSIVQAS